VNTVSRYCKTCCLRLTADKIYFILNNTLWCEINQSNFFDEYKLEGKDDTGQILMNISPDNLSKALRNCANATTVKIKLSKKQVACISVEIALPAQGTTQRIVTHDVPITLIPLSHWKEYEEPTMPEFDVSIYLPPLRILRTVVERIKNLDNHVTVSASWEGNMTLRVNSELVNTTTYFNDLDVPQLLNGLAPSNKSSTAEVTVEIKKLSIFLSGQTLGSCRAICNIVSGRALQLFLIQDDVQLQYFLPAIECD